MAKRVIIVGGGLAGLAAAVPLASGGLEVTLLERRPFLGGRAASYPMPPVRDPLTPTIRDPARPSSFGGGQGGGAPATAGQNSPTPAKGWVDNCQHVLLRGCTNLLDFYRRLGVEQGIAFFDRIVFLDGEGHQAMLNGSRWVSPLHLLPSFLRFSLLGWRDKVAIAYALFCALREQSRIQELDRVTMLEWLQRHRQPRGAIDIFWRTVLVSALNERLEVASARYGLKVVLDGLLRYREAFHVGVPVVPLRELYTEPCLRFLRRHAGGVRLRCQVSGIAVKGTRVQGVLLEDGTRMSADYYLSGVPPHVLLNLLSRPTVESYGYFANLRRLGTSPITAVYLWFDRQVTDLPFAALPGCQMQWLFSKGGHGRSTGWENGHHLGLVASASGELLPLGRGQIVEMALRDVRRVFPLAREATLLGGVVIKEPFATFSCRTACDEVRPDQKSPLENLFVAGDWTQTGWPATMEGAVRSGYRCAELILHAEGLARRLVQPDPPPEGLAGWLSCWDRPRRWKWHSRARG